MGPGAYARKDQLSHRFLSQELEQLGTLANLFPAMFMGIAAFLLNVVIGRLVAMQREQIATLKAFGYSNLAVLWHYLKMVSVIAGLGILSGIALGVWLGQALSGIYTDFYHFPYLKFSLQPATVMEAALASLLAAGRGRCSRYGAPPPCGRRRRCARSRLPLSRDLGGENWASSAGCRSPRA